MLGGGGGGESTRRTWVGCTFFRQHNSKTIVVRTSGNKQLGGGQLMVD